MVTEFVGVAGLPAVIPLSRRHLAERVTKRPDFPAPHMVGRARFWRLTDILNWMDKQKAGR